MCLPIMDYGADLQVQAAAELQVLPEGSAVATLISDYAVMRDQARACDALSRQPSEKKIRWP